MPKLMGLENAGDPELSPSAFGSQRYLKILTRGNKLVPLQNHGVKTMSIGYLLR